MGLQKRASYWTLGCYYLIAIPVACFLGFKMDLSVYGLLGGILSAVIVQMTAYLCIIRTKNWQDVADEAIQRIKDEATRLAALEQDQAEDKLQDGYAKQV